MTAAAGRCRSPASSCASPRGAMSPSSKTAQDIVQGDPPGNNLVVRLFKAFSSKARGKRAAYFRGCFELDPTTRVLDLGSQSGSGIHAVLRDTPVKPHNVYIADIHAALLQEG